MKEIVLKTFKINISQMKIDKKLKFCHLKGYSFLYTKFKY